MFFFYISFTTHAISPKLDSSVFVENTKWYRKADKMFRGSCLNCCYCCRYWFIHHNRHLSMHTFFILSPIRVVITILNYIRFHILASICISRESFFFLSFFPMQSLLFFAHNFTFVVVVVVIISIKINENGVVYKYRRRT